MHQATTGIDWQGGRFWLAALSLFTLAASLPLYSERFIEGHDILFHLLRIEGIAYSMAGGDFPARLHSFALNGYGVPTGYFYPDLFLYIPAFLRLAGMPVAVAYNLYCFGINIITAAATCWAMAQLFRSVRLGSLAAIFYLGSLYRFVDIYSRAAVGEAAAMAFMPLALVSTFLVLFRSTSFWPAVVIGFTGVLSSHILSTFLLLLATIILLLVALPRLTANSLRAMGRAAFFITILNIWFYLPFYTSYQQLDFHMKAVAGFVSLPNTAFTWNSFLDTQGFLGWPSLGLLGLFLSFWLVRRYWQRWQGRKYPVSGPDCFSGLPECYGQGLSSRHFLILLGLTAFVAIAMTRTFPWDFCTGLPIIGPSLNTLQFPFRLAVFSTLGMTLLFAMMACHLLSRTHRLLPDILVCTLLAAIMAGNLHTLGSLQSYPEAGNDFGKIDWRIRYDTHEDNAARESWLRALGWLPIDYLYSDILYGDLVDREIKAPEDIYKANCLMLADRYTPAEAITDYQKIGTRITIRTDSDIDFTASLPLFYYPGYQAHLEDGTCLPVSGGEKHILQAAIPAGTHTVTISYHESLICRIAELVSLLGLAAFLYSISRVRQQ